MTDPFGVAGRELLDRLEIPQPWRGSVEASLRLIDELERQIAELNRQPRRRRRPSLRPLLLTVPGIGWVPAFTIAAESGDIARFASARSSAATPGSAPASTNPATRTAAARSQSSIRRRAIPTGIGGATVGLRRME